MLGFLWTLPKCVAIASLKVKVKVTQSCPTLCDPTDRSTPGLTVHHQLQEFTQTHVRWVSDTIQPSHPLSSPSPPALNLFQHQGLFQWVSSLRQVAKVLGFHSQWNSVGQNAGVGSLSLLQGIFPTQGWSPGFPWCRWILYQPREALASLKQNVTPPVTQ